MSWEVIKKNVLTSSFGRGNNEKKKIERHGWESNWTIIWELDHNMRSFKLLTIKDNVIFRFFCR